MKLKIIIVLFVSILTLSILTLTLFATDDVFDKIEKKTWFESNGFAGNSTIFYKTSSGLLKAIRQKHGSGVLVISSTIYDVEIIQDTILMFNGLDLKTSEKQENFNYIFDSRTGLLQINGKFLEIASEDPTLYAWTDKRKSFMTQIDLKLLSEISIEKNQIYNNKDLIKTLKDK